jgi:2-methylcitrate dehydratase
MRFDDGSTAAESIEVADAHPRGARPFGREDYLAKFRALAEGGLDTAEQRRFLDAAQALPALDPGGFAALTVTALPAALGAPAASGIFA